VSSKIVNITLKLDDKVTKPLRNVQKKFDGFVNQKFGWTKKVSQSLSGLSKASGFTRIAGSVGGLGSSLGSAGKEAVGLGGKLLALTGIAGLGAGGLLAMVKQTADMGDGLINVAKRIDFGVEAFQEYQYAAEQSGVTNEDYVKGLETFTRKIGEAKAGQGQLYTFLKKSNPELLKQVLGAKSNEKAFQMMIDSLGGVKDAQKQAAYAAMVFGKSGKNFTNLANEGSDGINKLRETARGLGVMTEEQARKADEFGDTWASIERLFVGIRNIIGSAVIPELQKLADQLIAFVKNNQPLIQAFAKDFAEKLPGAIMEATKAFMGIMQVVTAIGKIFYWLGDVFGYATTIIGILAVTIGKGLTIALWGVIKAVWAFGAALMATPLGWIIAAIVAVIAVLYLLWDNWAMIWGGIKSFTSTIIDWIVAAFDKVIGAFSGLKDMLPTWLGGKTSAEVNLNNNTTGSAAQNFAQAQNSKNESEVRVSFDNLPKGARVDSSGSKNVETDVRMGFLAVPTM
jgi:hypothetical protein